MTPKKIILLRHGQTDFNLKGIVQGSGVDSSLNNTGLNQALSFYEGYNCYGFEKLYTSALKRTHQTIQRFIDTKLPWVKINDLNEISWGKHEGEPISPEEDKYYQWMLSKWRLGDTNLKIEGGESPDDVAIRLERALQIIQNDKASKILVCMHGRAMRILLCLMMNYPLKNMDLFEHQNACVYELQFTGSEFEILRNNDVAHLVGNPVKEIVK